jgi:hypothetical protein
VEWPVNRIFEAGPGGSKKETLVELGQGQNSVVKHWLFIDDHLPHLQPMLGVDTIEARLALWGYTTGDSVQGIEVLEQEQCYPIIRHHLDLRDQTERHILPG